MATSNTANVNLDCNSIDYKTLGRYGEYINTFDPSELEALTIRLGELSDAVEKADTKQKVRKLNNSYNKTLRTIKKISRDKNRLLRKYNKNYPASVCFRSASAATLFMQLPEIIEEVGKIMASGWNAQNKAKAIEYMKTEGLDQNQINGVLGLFAEGAQFGTNKSAANSSNQIGSTSQFSQSYLPVTKDSLQKKNTFNLSNIPVIPIIAGVAAILILRR